MGIWFTATLMCLVAAIVGVHGQVFAPAPAPAPEPINVTGIIESGGQFGTFVSLLVATGLGEVFQSRVDEDINGITIFAPTNAAFAVFSAADLANLTTLEVTTLLQYHALPNFHPTSDLQKLDNVVMSTMATNGANYTINITQGGGTVVVIPTTGGGQTRVPIQSTLYNIAPAAIFSVGSLLVPEEMSGLLVPVPTPAPAPAPIIATINNASATPTTSSTTSPAPESANKGKGLVMDLFLTLASSFTVMVFFFFQLV